MSTTYRRYQEARDAAWRALLQLRVKALPADVEGLAQDVGMEIHPYPDPQENQRLWRLAEQVKGVCPSLRIKGHWHVFVRDSQLDDNQRRFGVAHELGHLLLGHGTRALAPGVRCFDSDENAGDLLEDPDDLQDYAADIFAIRLLAPACLLHELHIDNISGIMTLCALPPRAAALRSERMELLNQRDVFYTNPLERKVRDAFRPWLLSRKTEIQAATPLLKPMQNKPNPTETSVPLLLPEQQKEEAAPVKDVTPAEDAEPAPEEKQPEEPQEPADQKKRKRGRARFRYDRIIGALVLLAVIVALYFIGKK